MQGDKHSKEVAHMIEGAEVPRSDRRNIPLHTPTGSCKGSHSCLWLILFEFFPSYVSSCPESMCSCKGTVCTDSAFLCAWPQLKESAVAVLGQSKSPRLIQLQRWCCRKGQQSPGASGRHRGQWGLWSQLWRTEHSLTVQSLGAI